MKTKLFSLLLIVGLFSISCSKYEDPGEELVAPVQAEVLDLKASGNCTYTLFKSDNPTQEEREAYARIEDAMDEACWYYNKYTNRSKHIKVHYNPNVKTARGGGNNIAFGKRKGYQKASIAMHEMAHCFGVGTTKKWKKTLIKNGKYTGYHGKQKLKQIDGPNAVLKGDKWHFWPYGLGTDNNNTHKKISHVKILEAMRKDGLGK